MQRPFLLLLDLHGVLLQRVQKGNRVDNRRARQHRPPWKFIGKHYVWQRPYLRQFLDIVTTRYTVGLWSAAEERNVLPIISELSSDLQLTPPLMQRLEYLCYRAHCRPDPQSGKYAVVKYLPDIWNFAPFSDENTLIVDDTLEKVRHYPMSAVVIPEYNPENFPRSFNHDDTLLWLLLYIEYLSSSADSGNFPSRNIAQIRHSLLSFDTFCSIGRFQASRHSFSGENDQYSSHALAFFPRPGALYREPSEAREDLREANLALSGSPRPHWRPSSDAD